jgi:hypothetical protein
MINQKVTLLTLAILGANSAFAGDSNGLVSRISQYEGITMFTAGTHNNKPSCQISNNGGEAWAISVYSAHGKAMLALIMSAQAQGKRMQVWGDSSCSTWYSLETAASVEITD